MQEEIKMEENEVAKLSKSHRHLEARLGRVEELLLEIREQLNDTDRGSTTLKKRKSSGYRPTRVDNVEVLNYRRRSSPITPHNNAGFLQEDTSLESKPRPGNIEMQAVSLEAAPG